MALTNQRKPDMPVFLFMTLTLAAAFSHNAEGSEPHRHHIADAPRKIRVATFNCSLNRDAAGQLERDLNTDGNLQARKVAKSSPPGQTRHRAAQ
ncbi:MAG UNVERIFIED_CONTAM: hypothetical protein LVR18_33355 [Planctomycetaceae bacterium]